jgi:benzylsuccinate CoA-transferase BbsF subunit
MDYVLNGRAEGPIGNRHPLGAAAPHGVFPCAGDDRWIALAVSSDEEWRSLVTAMEDPEWARAPELAEAAGRIGNIDELHERLSAWTRDFDDRELARRLQQMGLAATPVSDVADLLNDPHFTARRTFIEVKHPLGFEETIYGVYAKTSGAQPEVKPGPMMGQDNDYVFKELLEIPGERYRRLLDEEVIY